MEVQIFITIVSFPGFNQSDASFYARLISQIHVKSARGSGT